MAVLVYWAVVGAFQYWSGAQGQAFGGYPDESSHYISGLLLRDYLAAGLPETPLAFALRYYTYLPFLGVGYWPPLFYGFEGLWMTAFGYQRAIVLLLPGLASALLSGTCFWLLVPYLGRASAFLFGLLFLLMPAVQWINHLIMVDPAFTLFCWWAGIAFGIWAETGSRWAAFWAGLLAAGGLLTKINSTYLLSLPVLFMLVTRQWSLLRRASFWIIPGVVAAVWGPWILETRELVKIGFEGLAHRSVFHVAGELGAALVENLLWFGLLALLGIAGILWRARRESRLLICALLPLCYAVFLLAARVGIEERFMLPILAPAVVLAGVGWSYLTAKWGSAGGRILLAGLSVVAFAAVTGFARHVRPVNEVRPVVEFLRARGTPEQVSVMVPSDAEGPFIAEFAMGDRQRPARLLVRPIKLLAAVDWNVGSYQARFHTPAELIALFDRFPVRYTVVPAALNSHSFPHDNLLKETLSAHTERWTQMAAAPGDRWLVYQRTDGRERPPREMEGFAREALSPRLQYVLDRSFGHP